MFRPWSDPNPGSSYSKHTQSKKNQTKCKCQMLLHCLLLSEKNFVLLRSDDGLVKALNRVIICWSTWTGCVDGVYINTESINNIVNVWSAVKPDIYQ